MSKKRKKAPVSFLLHLMATEREVRAIDQFVQKLRLKPSDPSEMVETRRRGYAWASES